MSDSDFAAKPYEVFDHTADVGLHASGSSLRELFAHVAEGMENHMMRGGMTWAAPLKPLIVVKG